MVRWLAAVLIASLVLSLVMRTAGAEPVAQVTLGTTTVSFDDTSEAALHVPLSVEDGWLVEGAKVIGVTHGLRRDTHLRDAFMVENAGDTGLELKLLRDRLRRPGTYQVTMELTLKGAPAADGSRATARPRLELSVARTPAIVQAASTVTLEVVRHPLLADTVRSTPLTVAETGRATRLTDVVIRQLGPGLRENAPARGTLEVKLLDPEKKNVTQVPAGTMREAALTVSDFELGMTTGTLAFTANEVGEPVLIPFSVSTRRGAYLVLLLFFLGGIAGHIFRKVGKDAQTRAALYQEGDRMISALHDLAERSPHALRKELAAQIVRIRQGAATSNEKLSEQLAAATTLLQRAVKDIDAALGAAQPRLTRLLQLEPLRDLPAPLDGLATSLEPLLDRAMRARETSNVAALEAALEAADNVVREALDIARPNLERLADSVSSLKQVLPRSPSELDDGAEVLDESASALNAARAPAPDEALAPMLVRLDTCARELGDYVRLAVRKLTLLAQDADSICQKDRKLARRIADAADVPLTEDPAENLGALARAIESLWVAIKNQIQALGSRAAEAENALMERDFRTALQKLEPFLEGTLGRGLEAASAARTIPEAAPASSAVPPRALQDIDSIESGLPLFDTRIESRSKLARRLQSLLAFAILPLGAYLTYGSSFVGTNLELFGILAAAFMTDFTADAAIATLEKVKKT